MPIKYAIQTAERFFIYRVLHVDDTPHRIALGVAVGIFVAWTPTFGLQMILTVLLATLLRGNKLVGLPFVWISNPVTAWPIYFKMNYPLGKAILRSPKIDLDRLRELFRIADSIMVLNYGEKIAEGSAEEVMENEVVKKAYLGSEIE